MANVRIQSKAWCFTAYDPNLKDEWLAHATISYYCYGVEICPETGRKHWQGYLELTNKCELSRLKKTFPPQIHWEKRKGTQLEAINYCKKDGLFHEHGSRITQGARSDLDAVKAAIVGGATIESIADDHFGAWVQYNKAFVEYKRLKQPKRDWVTNVHVLWGATGSGKSRYAVEQGATFVEYDKNGFMHGYDNQEVVCFDDFDTKTMTREVFLRLTDRYHTTCNVKGGSMTWNPKTIYFTSNLSPHDWYDADMAIQRRITSIKRFNAELIRELQPDHDMDEAPPGCAALPFGDDDGGFH